ncbi:MAG TPA: S24 family peptidase [bacterium]|nr:S24 family peptidase [bacterium]
MKTLADILKARIKELGYTDIKEFARAFDVPYELLRKVISNGHLPKDKTLMVYAEKFNLDLSELISTVYQQKAPTTVQHLFSRRGAPQIVPAGDFRTVPVLGKAACGPWLETHAYETDQMEPVDLRDPDAFFVIAEGESMIGGHIVPGSYLLVSPAAPVANGQIVLARRNEDEFTVKTYHHQADGTTILQPMNPAFEPIVVAPGEPLSVLRITEIRQKV